MRKTHPFPTLDRAGRPPERRDDGVSREVLHVRAARLLPQEASGREAHEQRRGRSPVEGLEVDDLFGLVLEATRRARLGSGKGVQNG